MPYRLCRVSGQNGLQFRWISILGAVEDRSFGYMIFLPGIPNCVPMPPLKRAWRKNLSSAR